MPFDQIKDVIDRLLCVAASMEDESLVAFELHQSVLDVGRALFLQYATGFALAGETFLLFFTFLY